MTYYKAVRMDYTDIFTGTIKYEVGTIVRHPSDCRMLPNDPTTYLSASIVPTDCIGWTWPCRLLRVTPVGRTVKRTDGQYPNKRGAKAWRVDEELPPWMVFGPQGQEVVALLERAGSLSPEEANALGSAWLAAWGAAREAAWEAAWEAAREAVREAAREAAWEAAWEAAREAVWGAVRGAAREAVREAARRAAWEAAREAAWEAAWEAARGAVWEAVWEAATALIVKDIITSEQFDILYGPWKSIMGSG